MATAATLYGADGSGGNLSNLYILDPTTGDVIQNIGPIGFAITGLAFDPTDGTLYGVLSNEADSPTLITIDTTTGSGTAVGGTQGTVADIAFRADGTLLGWCDETANPDLCRDDLVTINKTTGAITKVGEAGFLTAASGLAVDSSGTVYHGGFTPQFGSGLVTINPATGTATGSILYDPNPSPSRIGLGLAFDPSGMLFGIERVNTTTRNLVTIDTTTGAVTVIGPTADRLDAVAFELPPDSDGDGIADGADACPNSVLAAMVVIDGCDSGVANTLGADGCTISDDIAQCAADAGDHDEFVSCVAHLMNELKNAGVISGKDNGAIQRCAAQSSLP